MTIDQVARKLIDLCREARWEEVHKELYHKDIRSVEPHATGGLVVEGIEAVLAKNKKWADLLIERHSVEVSEPLIADGYFCCTMHLDVTLKDIGRVQSKELCVYEVENGKIVAEYFYHS